MKKNYTHPELNMGAIDSSDVITTSKFTYSANGTGDVLDLESLMIPKS